MHQTTFQALKLAMGSSVNAMADYLDRCRRKRNEMTYDSEGVVSSTDAKELLAKAKEFKTRSRPGLRSITRDLYEATESRTSPSESDQQRQALSRKTAAVEGEGSGDVRLRRPIIVGASLG